MRIVVVVWCLLWRLGFNLSVAMAVSFIAP
jgi:hypothetical protein